MSGLTRQHPLIFRRNFCTGMLTQKIRNMALWVHSSTVGFHFTYLRHALMFLYKYEYEVQTVPNPKYTDRSFSMTECIAHIILFAVARHDLEPINEHLKVCSSEKIKSCISMTLMRAHIAHIPVHMACMPHACSSK